jgi:hypothetical protein
MRFGKGLTIVAMGLSLATAVAAQERGFSGRLLLTGGVNTIEGAAGGRAHAVGRDRRLRDA